MAHQKLYRSDKDKIVAGVLGGLSEYADIDSTISRLIYIALLLATGVFPGVIFYLLAVAVIPKRPGETTVSND